MVGPESPRRPLLSGASFAVRDLSLFAGGHWARVVAGSPLVTRPNPPRQSAAIRTRNGLGRAIWQFHQATLHWLDVAALFANLLSAASSAAAIGPSSAPSAPSSRLLPLAIDST